LQRFPKFFQFSRIHLWKSFIAPSISISEDSVEFGK
jgi:hypothetical protein